MDNCCTSKKTGIVAGIIYGILPHSFCIAFAVLSVIGATGATALFKSFLALKYFIPSLIAISFLMATLTALAYLKNNHCLNKEGIGRKWRYLLTLYGVTILTNIFVFSYALPAIANANSANATNISSANLSALSIKVDIPCSGHASLIIDELKKENGVKNIFFKNPDIFDISYDAATTSVQNILNLEIFKTYKAVIN